MSNYYAYVFISIQWIDFYDASKPRTFVSLYTITEHIKETNKKEYSGRWHLKAVDALNSRNLFVSVFFFRLKWNFIAALTMNCRPSKLNVNEKSSKNQKNVILFLFVLGARFFWTTKGPFFSVCFLLHGQMRCVLQIVNVFSLIFLNLSALVNKRAAICFFLYKFWIAFDPPHVCVAFK